jgi:hypothetical protein
VCEARKCRQLVEEREVVGQRAANVRPLHLDDDLAPVAQLRRVHLAKAGRAEGLAIEPVEQLAQPSAQLLLDRTLDVFDRDRTDVVLQPFELADVWLGQEIGTRGQELAELHVRRPRARPAACGSTPPARFAPRPPLGADRPPRPR